MPQVISHLSRAIPRNRPMAQAQSNSPPLTRYLIIGCPRSGTTALHMAMQGHPSVSTLTDELETTPFFAKGLSSFTCGAESEAEKKGGHIALFDAMTSITAVPENTHRGAKVCARSPEEAAVLVDSLRTYMPGMRVILTIRDDLVAQYGSLRKARRSNVWHSWNPGADTERNKPLKMNGWLFRRYALNTLEVIRTLRTLTKSHHVLECSFERLLAESDDIYRESFAFLGLEARPVVWLKARKVNPPPADYIHNYNALTRILQPLRQQHQQDAVPGHIRAVTATLTRASKAYYWARNGR